MTTQTPICQSCSMPMQKPEDFGTNTDGSLNKDYCTHCFKFGAFNSPNETLDEMVESCIPFELKANTYPDEASAREGLYETLSKLKRWK